MGMGKTHLRDKGQPFLKINRRFAGKANDQVGGDDQVGDRLPRRLHQLAKAGRGTAPGHLAQLFVGSGLQGQMQMGA